MKKDLELILSYTQENDGCMEWVRCFNTDGYPRAAFDGNSNGKVHRIVWELVNKASAEGLVIRHKCDNPKCIRPDHLMIGTVADNVRDMDERDRRFRKMTPEIITQVKVLIKEGTKLRTIAGIVGINERRVSDIKRGRYTDDAKLNQIG